MTALLTPAEVAALFRVDPATVHRWAEDNRLSSIRTLGGHRRYRAAEVYALLDGQRSSGQTTALQTLVDDHYEGDPVRALKDLARQYGIAVTVLDRETSEDSAPTQPAPEQSAPARSGGTTQLALTTEPPPEPQERALPGAEGSPQAPLSASGQSELAEPQPLGAGLADLIIEPARPEPAPPTSQTTAAPGVPGD